MSDGLEIVIKQVQLIKSSAGLRELSDYREAVVGVSRWAWEFAVSSYRVLSRWLSARNGEALDAPLQRVILDIVWRLEELLHWFDATDEVLARAPASPLAGADLGLAEPGSRRPAEVDSADDQ